MRKNKVTFKDIKKMLGAIKRSSKPDILKIGLSTDMWKLLREDNLDFAQWTDEEIKNRGKNTGIIGVKAGIECYVTTEISGELMNMTI